MFSRALSKSILSKSGAEGIMYPSVKDDRGLNVAINPHAVDRAMHNTSCVLVRTKPRLYGLIDYEIFQDCIGLTESGDFIWSDTPEIGKTSIYNLTRNEFDEYLRRGDTFRLADLK